MLIYKEVFKKLKAAGYSTARIRKEKILPCSTIVRIQKNEAISTKTLEKICELLNCRVEDVIEYVPEHASNKTE